MPGTKQKSTRRDGGAVRGEEEGGQLPRESNVTEGGERKKYDE